MILTQRDLKKYERQEIKENIIETIRLFVTLVAAICIYICICILSN